MTKINYFGKATVYNFIVKDYHTYIANGIRVHNGGKGKYKK
jgi:intein/homing endonuclease